LGGGGNDVVKITNTNEIQILSAGYQKPAKTGKIQAQATLASGIGSLESLPGLLKHLQIQAQATHHITKWKKTS
jgi:hypothetical protein